jgi:hypothetical protein
VTAAAISILIQTQSATAVSHTLIGSILNKSLLKMSLVLGISKEIDTFALSKVLPGILV